jgi:hypothetical protein
MVAFSDMNNQTSFPLVSLAPSDYVDPKPKGIV